MKKTKLLPILWVIALCSINLVGQSSASDKGGVPMTHEARFKVFDYSTKAPIALAVVFDKANRELGQTDVQGILVLHLPASSSEVYQIRYPGFNPLAVRLTQADKKSADYDIFLQPIGTTATTTSDDVAGKNTEPGTDTELVKVYVKQEPYNNKQAKDKAKDKAKPEEPGAVEFAVQLSATSRPITDKSTLKAWEEIGPVFIQTEAGLYKVRIGPYDTQEAAKKVLLQVKSRGRHDAFIVVQQGIENHIPFDPETHGKSKEAVVIEPSVTAEKEMPAAEAMGEYKVRLVSYLHPGGFNTKDVDQYGPLESYRKGEWTIMMIGGFKTAKEANRVKEIVISKGYKDATVVIERDGLLEELE